MRKVYSRKLPALDLSALRVFIVDDNKFAVQILMRLMKAMRITDTFGCVDPRQALAEIGLTKPDIVIIDLEMPGLPGLELVRGIRCGQAGIPEDTAILVATAYADHDHVVKARNAGANWVLVKPLSFRNLYDGLVRVTLDDRPLIRSEGYTGPCRRSRATPPEQLMARRRSDDPGPR